MPASAHATTVPSGWRFRPATGGARVGTGGITSAATETLTPWIPFGYGSDLPPTVTVGVVDTGLAFEPGPGVDWLAGRVQVRTTVPGNPDIDRDPVPASEANAQRDQYGHGTFVSGVILDQAPACAVLMRRGLLTFEKETVEDAAVAAAIKDLVAADVDIINLSFDAVTGSDADGPPAEIKDALELAAAAGILIVVAAGNEPSGADVYPGSFANADLPGSESICQAMVTVGAVDESAAVDPVSGLPRRATFSNFGPWIRACANGVDVLGPYVVQRFAGVPGGDGDGRPVVFDGWARASGTSFAAAIVTGVIARTAAATDVSALQLAGEWGLLPGSPPADHYPVYIEGRKHPVVRASASSPG